MNLERSYEVIKDGGSADKVVSMCMYKPNVVRRYKRKRDKFHSQNLLRGHANAEARQKLVLKRKSIAHVPMLEHRKLTEEIMRKLCRNMRLRSHKTYLSHSVL